MNERLSEPLLPWERSELRITTGLVTSSDKVSKLQEAARLANIECGIDDRYIVEILPAEPQDGDDIARYRLVGSWNRNIGHSASDFWRHYRQIETGAEAKAGD